MILEVGQSFTWPPKVHKQPEPVPEPTPSRSLLDLPYELRHEVLSYALLQKDPLELQHPVSAGLATFCQPLFQTNSLLRTESLQCFYEVNDFLWIIDTENPLRSDPTTYPAPTAFVNQGRYIRPEIDPPLCPVLPFQYPFLMKHLKHLQINIYLPEQPSEKGSSVGLEESLSALAKAVEGGRRLASCHVLITGKRRAAQIPLTVEERRALEVLAEGMQVRGSVDVQTRHHFRAVMAGVLGMGLRRRMKAS